MRMLHLLIFTLCLSAMPAYAQDALSRVVVTVKPLHALVWGVMEGTGERPLLLVSGQSSPHTYHLLPSQARALQDADVIFAIGGALEGFLPRVQSLLPADADRVTMIHQPGLNLLPQRQGRVFDPMTESGLDHEHHHDHDHALESGVDGHIWLDPMNGMVMVDIITARLSARYPHHAATYAENAANLKKLIQAMEQDIRARMQPLSGGRFVVFHDAYQYFEQAFGLRSEGSVMIAPELMPGTRYFTELRQKIEAMGSVCVFREPQFDDRILRQLTEGTTARVDVLDPEGATIADGPTLYFNVFDGIARSFERCLGGARR